MRVRNNTMSDNVQAYLDRIEREALQLMIDLGADNIYVRNYEGNWLCQAEVLGQICSSSMNSKVASIIRVLECIEKRVRDKKG